MMSAVTTPRLRLEFDRFLYASVGDDNNGMPLTVLSALARLDLDPWEEASKLAQLKHASAVTQLASLLGALRNAPVADMDLERIAAPLIDLLQCPRHHAPPMLQAFAQATATKPPAVVSALLTIFTYLIFMLFSQWLMGSIQASRPIPATQTSASTIDSSRAPPSRAGPQAAVK